MRTLLFALALAFAPITSRADILTVVQTPARGNVAVEPNTLTNGLAAYWKFNETANGSDNVNRDDSWTNAYTLTDSTSVEGVAGKFDLAAHFELSNTESIFRTTASGISAIDFHTAQSFSGSCWVNFETQSSAAQYIISIWGATGTERQWALAYQGNAADVMRFLISADGSTITPATSAQTLNIATWYHIYWEYDADTDTIGISVNNETLQIQGSVTTIHDSSFAFRIGNRQGSADDFDGTIDEVALWNRILTTTERSKLYSGGSGYQIPLN